jgi:hypothetical protein
MKTEEFFPFRWVLNKVSRKELAAHVKKLHSLDKLLAKKCIAHAHWVGVYPEK